MSQRQPCLTAACGGEVLGTFLLVFLGCGAVHTAVTTGALSGAWQVGSVWGFAVAFAVYSVGGVSGAHINPAITLSLALFGGFPRSRVLPYWLAQMAGAVLAATLLYWAFADTIHAFETQHQIERGSPGSEITASMYGEYFPNPTVGIHRTGPAGYENLGTGAAMLIEVLATGILALCVMAFTDPLNRGAPSPRMAPFFIGMTVAALVAVFGPMTQACLNPARDFGPRLVAWFAGWDDIAFPGPRGAGATLLVYLVAPLVGGALGGLIYVGLLRPALISVPGEEGEAGAV